MSLLLWILAGIALFWALGATAKARGHLPSRISIHGPLVMVRTQRGRDLINRIASTRRLWRAWGNFGLGITIVVMFGTILLFVAQAVLTVLVQPEPTAVNRPGNVLVIPGVNEFLPLSVAPEILVGLAIGLVVHEGGHGILCRVEDIDIESLGLLFLTVLPAGAFVEQDEDSQWEASRGGRARMLAAGVTNNFLVTVVAFVLLFGPVVGSLGVASGAMIGGALDDSPAAASGIGKGTVITGIENHSIDSNQELNDVLYSVSERRVSVSVLEGKSTMVTRSIKVIGGIRGGPANLSVGQTVTSINGTPVHTLAGFRMAVGNASGSVLTLQTADGASHRFPVGAYVIVAPDGPFARQGATAGRALVITKINETRIVTAEDLTTAIAKRSPGDPIRVVAYHDEERLTYNVHLG
ncbi:MAG: PDZ domain-containing protein, partial [Halobacteriaceae archaeon]